MKMIRLSLLFASLFLMQAKPTYAFNFGSAFSGAFKSITSGVSHAAKGLRDRVAGAVSKCAAVNGELPGKTLFKMAEKGEKITDTHLFEAHAHAAKTRADQKHRKGKKSKSRRRR